MIRINGTLYWNRTKLGISLLEFTRLGEKLVFWRARSGKVYAAADRCPHRGVAFSAGKIQDDHLQCPFHGFEFDASGKCVLIPANGRNEIIPDAMRLNSYPAFEGPRVHLDLVGQPFARGFACPRFL